MIQIKNFYFIVYFFGNLNPITLLRRYLLTFSTVLLSLSSMANHIVGGEILYDHLGSDQYRITLKIYRDCNQTTNFDGTGGNTFPAFLTVYDGNSTLFGIFDVGIPVVTTVPPAFNNPCIQTPNTTCIEQGVYTYTLTLPPTPGGYTIVYQRCCRNAGIINMVNSVQEGSSYFTKIPGNAVNSSPRFTKFPPIYICNNVNFVFDHSATDPDGDQLVYSLCAPYTGLDPCCASLTAPPPPSFSSCPSPPSSCPGVAPPPPYANIIFAAPYSGSYPIASNPSFSINPSTGQLSGTPTLIAQYVVGVCVQEFRNGVLLNTHFRDFQFTVVGCIVTVQSAVANQTQTCGGQTISFINQSINNSPSPQYHWDFGVQNLLSDTSNVLNPTYMYPDTGTYMLTLITNPGKTCSDTLKKTVFVYPPLKIKYARPGPQCFKNNLFNFNAGGTFIPQTTFVWDFTSLAAPPTSTLRDPTGVQFLLNGLFLVKLRAKHFACRDSFTDTISVIGRPKAKISNLQNELCDPASISFSNASSSELPLRYIWTFSDGKTSNEFAPTKIFTPPGIYSATLVVETTLLCSDTSIAIVKDLKVNPSPTAAFKATPKETSIFEPEISVVSTSPSNPLTVLYDFGDGQGSGQPKILHTYAEPGTYTITQTIMNRFFCTDTASESVKILREFRFWVPNTFTPDDSRLNDIFLPMAIGIEQYELEIFDRWGKKFFHTNNIEEGWNGSYKGAECQQGIYAWKITFKNTVSEIIETRLGHVLLLRNP